MHLGLPNGDEDDLENLSSADEQGNKLLMMRTPLRKAARVASGMRLFFDSILVYSQLFSDFIAEW